MKLLIGSPAPDFTILTDTNNTWSLKDHKGEWVVVYFYPKDNTPGCTIEACAFRDQTPNFNTLKGNIIGISRDSVKSHQKFKEKFTLTFPLGSDEDGSVCQAYGVWVEKSFMGKKYFGIERTTFLINPEGLIHCVWHKVKIPGHVAEVMRKIEN